MVSIYDYLDYRKFLSDLISEKRQNSQAFSQRAILQRLGVKSSGYLANMLAGRSSLSLDQAVALGGLLGLDKQETEYLKNLLHFDKAKSVTEKNEFFEKLLASRNTKIKILNALEYTLFDKWYYIPIRELLEKFEFNDDWELLGSILIPKVPASDVKTAVAALSKGGFIQQDVTGKWMATDPVISTGDEIYSFKVMRFQKDMLTLAERALATLSAAERDIGGVSFSISSDKLNLIKEEVRKFRRKIIQIAEDEGDAKADQVYRCSVQLFPLSKTVRGL